LADKAVAAAAKAKTSLILSLNVLNGGKTLRGCYHADSRTLCSMTANEIRTYGALSRRDRDLRRWDLEVQINLSSQARGVVCAEVCLPAGDQPLARKLQAR